MVQMIDLNAGPVLTMLIEQGNGRTERVPPAAPGGENAHNNGVQRTTDQLEPTASADT